MKSSSLLPLLLFLTSTQAARIPRSQHDSMLERNFKNVLQRDAQEAHVVRSPQGPASNPGEFTGPDLSNSNPRNPNYQSGSGSGTGSGEGSNYVPEPMMDGTSSTLGAGAPSSTASAAVSTTPGAGAASSDAASADATTIFDTSPLPNPISTAAASATTIFDTSPLPNSIITASASGIAFIDLIYPPSITSGGSPDYGLGPEIPLMATGALGASGSGYPPLPTGGYYRHYNGSGNYRYGSGYGEDPGVMDVEMSGEPDGTVDADILELEMNADPESGKVEPDIMEVQMSVKLDGEVDANETLWRYNGTGWNHTNIPMPSGTVIGTLLPVYVSTGSGGPMATGNSSPSFVNGAVRPGFTGPKKMSDMEIANDGTGMEEMGDDVGMKRAVGEKKRWLSGLI